MIRTLRDGSSRRLLLAGMLLMALSPAVYAAAAYISEELPTPASTDETVEPMEFAFRPSPGGELNLHLRNYYFNRDRDHASDSKAWAQGGALVYTSDWWKDRVRFGVAGYTSQKLHGPEDKDGTLLLKPGQHGFSVLGEGWLEIRAFNDIYLKLYRQRLNLPFINSRDNRMLPVTYEAATLIDRGHGSFIYGFGQIEQIKLRNDDQFVSMTEAAGIKEKDRGVTAAGSSYEFGPHASIGAMNAYAWDFMNIFYVEANGRLRTLGDWGFQFSAQYSDQQSVGDELGGDFDTHQFGAKLAVSHFGFIATLGYTTTDNNAGIKSPWGGSPSYTSVMIEDFDRAGEDAWLIGISSDFSRLGFTGWSASINYVDGDTPDRGSIASPDTTELDITVGYRFESGPLKGLDVRLRRALVDKKGSRDGDVEDFRVIVNYRTTLF